jgi:hypothetical protein
VAGQTDPNCYYQMWFQVVFASRTPYMSHNGADAVCTAKFARVVPLSADRLRQGVRRDRTATDNLLLSFPGMTDSIIYCVWKPDRPGTPTTCRTLTRAPPRTFAR